MYALFETIFTACIVYALDCIFNKDVTEIACQYDLLKWLYSPFYMGLNLLIIHG